MRKVMGLNVEREVWGLSWIQNVTCQNVEMAWLSLIINSGGCSLGCLGDEVEWIAGVLR